MKRYLISGALMLIAGLLVTSCHDKMENEYISNPVTVKTEEFEKAFKEAFTSDIAPNQDWGFGSSSAGTRAFTRAGEPEVVKKDVWKNSPAKLDGNTVPADVTKKEAKYVYEWFQKEENKGLTEEGQPWSNFFIQQVYGTMNLQKKGIWHRYDQNRINNGYDSNYYDEEFTDKGGMDYLTVGDGTTMTHVNDFNAETGGPWNIVYMRNSSAMKFGYHSSWDNSDRQLFKLAKITVPGDCFEDGVAREGWYVGLSLLAEKYDNGDKILGWQRKDWGDDWILKVVPGKGSTTTTTPTTPDEPEPDGPEIDTDVPTPTPVPDTHVYKVKTTTTKTEYYKSRTLIQFGRVFCEDLGGNYVSNHKDFDYNDVVFDAYLWMEEECQKVTEINTYEVNIYKEEPLYEVDEDGYVIYYDSGGNVTTVNNGKPKQNGTTKELVRTEKKVVEGTPVYSKVSGAEPKFYADICLLACGATKSIKVGGDDTKVKEVHEAFGGYAADCIINTFDEHTISGGGFGYHETAEPVTFTQVDITKYVKENGHVSTPTIGDIPVFVQWSTVAAKSIDAPTGAVPQKFMSTAKDNWTSERCFLGDAYTNFKSWVTYPDKPFNKDSNSGFLYQGYPSPEAGFDFTVTTGVTTALEIETSKTTYAEVANSDLVENYLEDENGTKTPYTPTGDSGKTLWANANGTMLNWGGDISIDKSEFASATSSSKLRFYGECTNPSNWQIYLKDQNWSDIVAAAGHWISNDLNNTGYVEFVIGNYLSQLKNGGVLVQGTGFKLTQVDLIR